MARPASGIEPDTQAGQALHDELHGYDGSLCDPDCEWLRSIRDVEAAAYNRGWVDATDAAGAEKAAVDREHPIDSGYVPAPLEDPWG